MTHTCLANRIKNTLRIPDSYHAKTLKIHTPWYIFTSHVCDVSGVIILTSCVCLCVGVSVTTLMAKRTDIQTWIPACRSSGRISRSSSKVKVIGQRSRSLGQKTFFKVTNSVWNWIHSTPYMNGRATTWGVFKVYAFFLLYIFTTRPSFKKMNVGFFLPTFRFLKGGPVIK